MRKSVEGRQRQPRFALVQCQDALSSGHSGGHHGEMIALELAEIEGVEVDEIGHGSALIETQVCDDKSDGSQNTPFKAFGICACPECESADCSRPVQESCGHVKCRRCYISHDVGCRQCITTREKGIIPGLMSNQGQQGEIESTKNDANRHSFSEEDDDENAIEEVYIEQSPNEYILELEQASGGKSLAIVSSETLFQLGIKHPAEIDSGGTNSETPNSENEICNYSFTVSDESPISRRCEKSDSTQKQSNPKTWDHIITLGSEPPKFQCTRCNTEFMHKYQFKYHLFCNPANGNRPFRCAECSEDFISRSHYEYHVRSKHTGERPFFECEICNQKFSQKVKLNRHLACHGGKPTPTITHQFMCVYCKKRFRTLSNCKKHIRLHTQHSTHKSKNFKCKNCNKQLSTKSALDSHLKIHMQERPHKCPDPECPRAFTTAKDLKRHYLCHTGEQPFRCYLCHTNFRRKDNLERHIRKCHKLPESVIKSMGREAANQYYRSKQLQASLKGEQLTQNPSAVESYIVLATVADCINSM